MGTRRRGIAQLTEEMRLVFVGCRVAPSPAVRQAVQRWGGTFVNSTYWFASGSTGLGKYDLARPLDSRGGLRCGPRRMDSMFFRPDPTDMIDGYQATAWCSTHQELPDGVHRSGRQPACLME
jgi:hypothetical protein